MTISFIIPAHNEEKYIGDCLQSIIDRWSSHCLEIIVVDNASTDATVEIAQRFPYVRVVQELSEGSNRARQKGLMEARGDCVAYIDADTRIPEGWISKAEQAFSNDWRLVCLSGPLTYYDYDMYPLRKMVAEWLNKVVTHVVYLITRSVVYGGNFVARRDALLSIGGFNTTITFYGDDTDLARRLKSVGKVKFMKDFFIYTSVRRLAQEGLIRTYLIYSINYIWIIIFHKPFTKKHYNIR